MRGRREILWVFGCGVTLYGIAWRDMAFILYIRYGIEKEKNRQIYGIFSSRWIDGVWMRSLLYHASFLDFQIPSVTEYNFRGEIVYCQS